MNELVRFALVAFYPREGDLPGLAELDVEDKIAALRRDATPLFWFGVVSAALFFQLSPIVTIYRPWPAIFLDEDELDRHAHRLATFPVYLVRQLIVLLKLIAGMFWGQSEEIRAFLALPAYGADPGTRRTGAVIAGLAEVERAPLPALVTLGKREEARGRAVDAHALDEGKNA